MKDNFSKKKRFFASIIGALGFVGLMMLFDKYTDPERFMNENYWKEILFMGVWMFIVYYFLSRYKHLRWKDIFSKKE